MADQVFDRNALVALIPEWQVQESDSSYGKPLSLALQNYLDFYQLNFSVPNLKHRIGFIYFDNSCQSDQDVGRLVCQQWCQPQGESRGAVLVNHGYFDHVGLFRHVIAWCLDAGFDVFSYDLPGHGLSSGPRATVPDFSLYQQAFQQVINTMFCAYGGGGDRPFHIIAQSTGGAIVMDYLLQKQACSQSDEFNKVVLLAPLVRSANWNWNRSLHSIVSLFSDSVARKFAPNSNDEAFLHFLKSVDPMQCRRIYAQWFASLRKWVPHFLSLPVVRRPLVVVQGMQDGTVDWRYNMNIVKQKFFDVDVHYLPIARHQLANERSDIREQIEQWVLEAFNETPSK